jgi:hypothetical protein
MGRGSELSIILSQRSEYERSIRGARVTRLGPRGIHLFLNLECRRVVRSLDPRQWRDLFSS